MFTCLRYWIQVKMVLFLHCRIILQGDPNEWGSSGLNPQKMIKKSEPSQNSLPCSFKFLFEKLWDVSYTIRGGKHWREEILAFSYPKKLK